MRISESGGVVTLASSHDTKAQGLVAKLKFLPMPLFKGIVKKAILQDLKDIKAAVEQEPTFRNFREAYSDAHK
jgi:hypothetical protein